MPANGRFPVSAHASRESLGHRPTLRPFRFPVPMTICIVAMYRLAPGTNASRTLGKQLQCTTMRRQSLENRGMAIVAHPQLTIPSFPTRSGTIGSSLGTRGRIANPTQLVAFQRLPARIGNDHGDRLRQTIPHFGDSSFIKVLRGSPRAYPPSRLSLIKGLLPIASTLSSTSSQSAQTGHWPPPR